MELLKIASISQIRSIKIVPKSEACEKGSQTEKQGGKTCGCFCLFVNRRSDAFNTSTQSTQKFLCYCLQCDRSKTPGKAGYASNALDIF